MKLKGIDVSAWQEIIDWDKVKNQIDFAILRVGYGDNITSQDDKYFKRNADECTRLGIPFGVYIYSYAMSVEQAESEADHVLRLIKGYKLNYPIYLDLEDEKTVGTLSNDKIAEITKVFCNDIENAGYLAGVYANTNWFNTRLTDNLYNRYTKWVAQYAEACTYRGSYDMWQYASDGRVEGANGNIDMNYCYRSFEVKKPSVVYQSHIQDIGWQDEKRDGETSGTVGQSRRLEALTIRLENTDKQIHFSGHIQNKGWTSERTGGEIVGTVGEALRLEAIKIWIEGKDVAYRVHVQNKGWTDWKYNGQVAGTVGEGLRIEAIQIHL